VPHLDPDRLVDLALFDSAAEPEESAHLDVCAGCRTEIGSLQHVATLGKETEELRDLPAPPESVWAGIAAATAEPVAPVRPLPAARTDDGRRRRRRTPKWVPPFLLATAAALVAIAGTVTVVQLVDRPPAAEVTARATLSPLRGAPPAARGDAEVVDDDELRVDVSDLPLTNGYYEVWLIDPDDTSRMQSLGGLPADAEAVLPIPPGTDLRTYRLVDVSAEPHDGNSAHSGDSLLRGTLTS
jgi:anti-sigma-K factor RskA